MESKKNKVQMTVKTNENELHIIEEEILKKSSVELREEERNMNKPTTASSPGNCSPRSPPTEGITMHDVGYYEAYEEGIK